MHNGIALQCIKRKERREENVMEWGSDCHYGFKEIDAMLNVGKIK